MIKNDQCVKARKIYPFIQLWIGNSLFYIGYFISLIELYIIDFIVLMLLKSRESWPVFWEVVYYGDYFVALGTGSASEV